MSTPIDITPETVVSAGIAAASGDHRGYFWVFPVANGVVVGHITPTVTPTGPGNKIEVHAFPTPPEAARFLQSKLEAPENPAAS